ncbi:MAG: type II toxin-antitoxin system HipA family toxin [Acidimicrobiia bacterium]
MSEIDVFVSVANRDVQAGRLFTHHGRGTESATFTYDSGYLADVEAYELDPALPLVTGGLQTPEGRPMFNAFTDAAPDRWGRGLIDRLERLRASTSGTTPRRVTEFDYLVGVRDDLRQGALRLRDRETGRFVAADDAGIPALTDLPELLSIAKRVEDDAAGVAELQRLVRAGSSLGGARPKTHVLASGGRLAIAKFPSSSADTWNVMAWEKVALDLARSAGITVPDSDLIHVAGRSVLITYRFDRSASNKRIGYSSALTMLEAVDGDTRSYLEIADAVSDRSPHATADLIQLWRRMAFNVLVSNTDDHLRNHGFLYTGSGAWRLSPAFDLNPDPEPGPKYLATAIDDGETEARVDTLLGVAPYFRLESEEAVRVLRQVSDATAAWRAAASHVGLSAQEIRRMEPAFVHEAASDAARS